MNSPDLLLVGGGLANGLIAWRLLRHRPGLRVALVERDRRLGGNHTWSFHGGDLDSDQQDWIEPLIVHRWPAQTVRFPGHSRRLDQPYSSLTSARLDQALRGLDGLEIHAGQAAAKLEPGAVVLEDGQRLEAAGVVDGRGPGPAPGTVLGFQKFIGQELRLDAPHGLDVPVIMDATVSQDDGYRFIYLLPFGEREVLVEDTRYTDGDELAEHAFREGIEGYLQTRNWRVDSVIREESGVLPILLAGDFEAFWPAADPVARSGLRAGLFHPTTGYSLPQAAALADAVAEAWPVDGAGLARLTRTFARNLWARTGFFRLLNRMLFRAGAPERRYRVLERFYRLDEGLITRFYAGRLTLGDRARILSGKPPVPVLEALGVLRERPMLDREAKSS